jgi:hypothetical protein
MDRRNFFGWIGKISLMVGLGFMAHRSDGGLLDESQVDMVCVPDISRMRMNGRACRDFRMISSDQSIFLDKDIFGA